jgi:hypothetical protein
MAKTKDTNMSRSESKFPRQSRIAKGFSARNTQFNDGQLIKIKKNIDNTKYFERFKYDG